MSEKKIQTTPEGNRLLASLPTQVYQRILSNSESVQFSFGEVIYQPNDIIREVYFLNSGIISLLSTIGEQAKVEVGIVGKEGIVGLSVFLGVPESRNLAVVQGTGTGLKIKTDDFLTECEQSDDFSRLLQRYTHLLLTQISQSAVCNRFHQVDERLARWLLMTHDRMENAEFQLTQEFLSNMLGVRREAVTIAAGNLQQQNLISYSRGKIKILDRLRLENVACKCYSVIKDEERSCFLNYSAKS